MTAPIQTLVVERAESVALRTVDDHSTHAIVLPDRPADRAMAMINHAIERGLPVETLEKLLEMEERVSKRQAAEDFNRSLAAFQAEVEQINKTKGANFTTKSGGSVNYAYAPLPEMQRQLRPYLIKHGFAYGWDQRLERDQLTVTFKLRHINGHSETNSFTLPVENASAASPQQKIGIADTYAERRTMMAGLGLTVDQEHPDTKAVDPTPITEDQATTLNDLITELGGNARALFLKHFDIGRVEQLRAVEFTNAVNTLEETKRKRAARKP